MHFVVMGKIAGVVCFFKQKQCLEHQSVALKEVCGGQICTGTYNVCFNKSFHMRERERRRGH